MSEKYLTNKPRKPEIYSIDWSYAEARKIPPMFFNKAMDSSSMELYELISQSFESINPADGEAHRCRI